MSAKWLRLKKLSVALSYGGITLGILQGLGGVNFASMFTQLLTMWLTALVTILLGGDVSQLLGTTTT